MLSSSDCPFKEETYCVRLSLEGRYVLRQIVPLRYICVASDCPFKAEMYCVRLSL